MRLLLLLNFVNGRRLELMYKSLIITIKSSLFHLHGFLLLLLLFWLTEITSFVSTNSKFVFNPKFRQDSNHCKEFLKSPNLLMHLKQGILFSPKNLVLETFDEFLIKSFNKGKCAKGPEVLSSASDKVNLFAEFFSENSSFDDSGISLPSLPSRTYMKVYNINVTSKMVTMS